MNDDTLSELMDKCKDMQSAIRDIREAGYRRSKFERLYRAELAKSTLEFREQGMPATIIPDLTRGDEKVGELRFQRDMAKVDEDVAQKLYFVANSEYKTLDALMQIERQGR